MSGYKTLVAFDIENVDGTSTHYNINDIVPIEKLMPRKFDWLVERGYLEGTLSGTTSLPDNLTITGTVSASGLGGSLLSSANPIMDSTAAPGTSTIPSRQDHVHPSDTTRAPLSGATFTGDVTLDKASPLLHIKSDYADDTTAYLKITRRTGKRGGMIIYTDDNVSPKLRWYIGPAASTESGSDAGAELAFISYADDGTTDQGSRLTISRATGQVELAEELIAKANAFTAVKTADFTSTNNTWETLDSWASETDPQAAFDLTSGEFTVPTTGLWLLTGWASFAASATGARGTRILVNSATVPAFQLQPGVATYASRATCVGVMAINSGTSVEFQTWQTSGGDLTVQDAYFSATYLGKSS